VALVRHNEQAVCTTKWPGLRIKLSVPAWIIVSSQAAASVAPEPAPVQDAEYLCEALSGRRVQLPIG